jgi:hypothetical protein
MSLRTRIALVVAGCVAASVVTIAAVSLVLARSQARGALDDTLVDRAEQLGSFPTTSSSR